MIISLAIISLLFPLMFGLYYQIADSIRTQLVTHQLFNQFDRFYVQLQADEANGVKMVVQKNQIEMRMKDGLQIRYQWKQGQLIRSIKPTSSTSYRGNTLMLYYVKRIYYQNVQNGVKMTIVLANQNATYTGIAYIWGRIDE
jgi:hypothetical protein